MPICVHCDYPARAVYTVYQSARNTRLELCDRCTRFTDPLIEHPLVLILLDLVLLKPRVFRHLIFNRGSPARRAGRDGELEVQVGGVIRGEADRGTIIWDQILKLGIIVTLVESLVLYRQTHASTGSHGEEEEWVDGMIGLGLVVLMTFFGNVGQHLTTTWISWGFLRWMGWLDLEREVGAKVVDSGEKDGRRRDFRLSMISLTLLYASVLPLCLHLVLLVWPPTSTPSVPKIHVGPFLYFPSSVPRLAWLDPLISTLEREKIDEMWISTHLLSGMSSGLALRVLLPTKPWATMVAVLAGWIVKAGVQGGLTTLMMSS